MSLFNLELLSLAVQRMRHSAARQQVIAENIANADTPGYRARDVAAFEFQRELRETGAAGGALRRTDPAHLAAPSRGTGEVETEESRWEILPSGNSVTLEHEMLRMSHAKLQHDQAAVYYRKAVDLLRAASGGRF